MDAKNHQSNNLEDQLRTNTRNNIKKLIAITGLSHNQFAVKNGITPPTLTSYLKQSGKTIMSLTFLMNVCMMPELKENGLNLTLSDLVSPDFDPVVRKKGSYFPETTRESFLGTYYCFFYEQAKSPVKSEFAPQRSLRFGVLALFDGLNTLSEKARYEAYAVFYKAEKREKSIALKKKADRIFNNEKLGITERNSAIRACFREETDLYSGSLHFTDASMFISLSSDIFHDMALLTFTVPNKRLDKKYIGGIGMASSVTHGSERLPISQKIILSAYPLGCSDEVIAEHLSMVPDEIEIQPEPVTELREFCEALFRKYSTFNFLDDYYYKDLIVQSHIKKIITDHLQNCIFALGSVSKEEDSRVYQMIKEYADSTD